MSKSVKKNYAYQSVYQILLVLGPLITAPYIARVLGAEKIGVYSYYFSIAFYFGVVAMLGVANYGSRSIAKAQSKGILERSKVFKEILFMQFLMSVLIILAYAAYLLIFNLDNKINATIEILYVLSVCTDISWFFFGMEEFRVTTIRSVAVKLATIASIVLFVKKPEDINLYTFIMAGGMLLNSLALWTRVRRYMTPVRIALKDIVRHIRPNLVLFVPEASLALIHALDKVLLGSVASMAELGYYVNADKIVTIPLGLIFGLGSVMLPRISGLCAQNKWDAVNRYINKSLLASIWMSVCLCFGIISVSDDFVPFFFGPGYEQCIGLLKLFSVVLIIKAIANTFRMQYLVPAGKDKEYTMSVVYAAVVNVIFNSIFIPRLGAVGAVLGTVIAEAIVLVFYYAYSRKVIRVQSIKLTSVLFIASGAVMMAVVFLVSSVLPFENHFYRLLAELGVGAVIYCSATAAVLYFTRRDVLISLRKNAKALLLKVVSGKPRK